MQHQVFITFLAKKFSGEISTEELVQLNNWLAADVEHQRIAAAYQQVWNDAIEVELGQEIEPDLDAAFSGVMSKIKASEATNTWLSFSWGSTYKAAAAVAVLASAVWGYNTYSGNQVEMTVVSADQGDKKEVTLPDGSVVSLRQGSQISYPKTFASNLRCVELKGEAYFEVTHNPTAHFCITTEEKEKIEVLGTSFNVKQTTEGTSVLVKTGKVKFDLENKTDGPIVPSGQLAFHPKASQKFFVTKALSYNELAWKSGHLEFINVPFKQVISDLESYFNVSIQVENHELLNCTYTSTKVPSDLKQALSTISNTFNIKISYSSSNHIILNGGTCL